MTQRTFFNAIRLGLSSLRRDWQSGELRLLTLAVILAVAAMSSVGFFVDRLRIGLDRNAAQLLGGDLVLISDTPIDPALDVDARRRGLAVVHTVAFQSMSQSSDQAKLVSIKAVTDGYPLRGLLRTASTPSGPDHVTQGIPKPGSVWVDPSLLEPLHARVGGPLQLGDREFVIDALVTVEPDRGLSFASLAPRVLMREDDLPSTHLLQAGSRDTQRLMVAGQPSAVSGFERWLQPRLKRGQRIETLEQGRPEVKATLDRAGQFLSLVALLTGLLVAIAIGLASRRFSERHLDGCAVMKCLGISQRNLLTLFVTEFIATGAIASMIGVIVGFIGHFAFVDILSRVLGTQELPMPSLEPGVQGFSLGFVLLLCFALPPVIRLGKVPPLRVLRRDVGFSNTREWMGYGLGALVFAALMLWIAGDARIGAYTAGGFALSLIAFGLACQLALWVSMQVRKTSGLPPSVRFALASMYRRPLATTIQTVSLALGLMALVMLSVTRTELITDWRRTTPPGAPDHFAINIQDAQRDDFRNAVKNQGVGSFDYFPMIRGRLTAIDGRAVGASSYPEERAQRLVDREFNLSYTLELPPFNQIVDGTWFDAAARQPEVSVEEGIAKTLGLHVGQKLRFEVGGTPLEARISSLRKLHWDSMHVNFFMLFNPQAVHGLPQTWIAAFHEGDDAGRLTNALSASFPAATIIDTGAVLKQIQDILDQVILAVEFLFIFTVAAGLLVLYAALLSSRDERIREAALLRALGASRKQLTQAQVVEFLGTGLLAGVLAAGGATALSVVLAIRVFNFPVHLTAMPWIVSAVAGASIALAGGWWALRSVLQQPPLNSLRDL